MFWSWGLGKEGFGFARFLGHLGVLLLSLSLLDIVRDSFFLQRLGLYRLRDHSVVGWLEVDLVFHELQPPGDRIIVLEEILVDRYEFLDEEGRFLPELPREVGRQNFHADVAEQLLPLDQVVDILVVQAGLQNQEIDALATHDAV